jgi:beta-xylosidase/mannose-6-phosphate isomerase-like protein (cupin superfamily)
MPQFISVVVITWCLAGTAVFAQGAGVEGQRIADLGNGTYLNPIMSGDHPDPSILKDGDDYYMTFSSFDAYPGLVIWHSRDLVNWEPIEPALFKNVGSVWAPDLVKHNGRYYIYFPGIGPYRSNYVVWADNIHGPWSDPIDLKIGQIDPGHAVGPDGKRYLFLSAGRLVQLADDGLSVAGAPRKVYDGWKYPEDWIVEGFAQEGPKILKHGEYYYMVLAEGGTAGPPTGHMIVAARSKTIEGPWENSPYNPIVRTASRNERWWSKGHGTLVEARDGKWFIVYHAYENGFYTLGRQTLLEPIEWTADGWFKRAGADTAAPISKPAGDAVRHGFAYSDDFSSNKMGVQWSFYKGSTDDRDRYRYADRALILKAKGTTPADSSPLWFVTGDHSYEVEVEIDADPGASAGLLLFYSRKLYAGLGYSAKNLIMHQYGIERPGAKPGALGQHVFVRLRNDENILTMFYSADGREWQRFDRGIDVSGYHHNVAYDFLSLRPALYAAGEGEVRFRNFRYRAIQSKPPALTSASQIQHDREIAIDEPGTHDGGGMTTGFSFFKDIKDLPFVFRKRALHPGSGIGHHEQKEDEIYYVLSGRGELTLDRKRSEVGPGTAILTRPGSTHSLRQLGTDDLVIIIVYPNATAIH